MPRYYGQQIDPLEMQQMAGNPFYNPELSRPDWYRGIMSVYANLKGAKEEKEAKKIAAEERKWRQMETAARIRNLDEPNRIPQAEKPTSKVSPVQVKTMMNRLDYPEEAVAEVDTMNDIALRDTWAKLQQDFAARQLQGMKVPKTAATNKGRLQLQRLKYAQDLVNGRKAQYTGALTQLLSNPDKAMLAPGLADELQKKIDDIDTQAGEIGSMMNNIDETGELTEDQFMKLNTILKFKTSYRPFIEKPKEGETGTTTQTKTINGVPYYRWSDGQWRPKKPPTQTKK